jgi:hypothetical protein
MKRWQMMASRLWAGTFGLFPIYSLMLKKFLVAIFIKQSKSKYVAASKYFDMKQFLKK